MRQVIAWSVAAIVITVLVLAGIWGLHQLQPSDRPAFSDRRQIVDAARELAAAAWAEQVPAAGEAACLKSRNIAPQIKEEDGGDVFRVTWRYSGRTIDGQSRREYIRLRLDRVGRLIGEVECSVEGAPQPLRPPRKPNRPNDQPTLQGYY